MSTAFERAIIERGDCHILHEPFCVPFYWGPEGEAQSKLFEKDGVKDTSYSKVAQKVYDEQPTGKKFVFSKDMAYYIDHLFDDKEFLRFEQEEV